MTNEQLKEIIAELWRQSDDVRGGTMVTVEAVEETIRDVCGLWGFKEE